MVVLNAYGKIEPICISEKLKLYIKNLPSEEHDNWQEYIRDELLESMKMREIRLGRYEHKDDILNERRRRNATLFIFYRVVCYYIRYCEV